MVYGMSRSLVHNIIQSTFAFIPFSIFFAPNPKSNVYGHD